VSTGSVHSGNADHPSPESKPGEPRLKREASRLRILFLDDDPDRARAFLLRRPEALWVQTAEECIARLAEVWDQVHLDHDLGGEVFVDSNRPDCGMEVIRWLCNEPPERFGNTLFIVHTYNAEAGETMVKSLRESRYEAIYRPFGVDLVDWLTDDGKPEEAVEEPPLSKPRPMWTEWIRRLSRKLRPGAAARDRAPWPKGENSCQGSE